MTSSILHRFRQLRAWSGVRFEVVHGGRRMAEIRALRARTYEACMPYMLAAHGVADAYDARAIHVLAFRGDRLVGALRLVPSPGIETAEYFPGWAAHVDDRPMLELGRFVVDPAEQHAGIGTRLVAEAIRWASPRTEYHGLVAFARESMARRFFRMGMRVVERREAIEGKSPEPYYLLMGTRRDRARFFRHMVGLSRFGR